MFEDLANRWNFLKSAATGLVYEYSTVSKSDGLLQGREIFPRSNSKSFHIPLDLSRSL